MAPAENRGGGGWAVQPMATQSEEAENQREESVLVQRGSQGYGSVSVPIPVGLKHQVSVGPTRCRGGQVGGTHYLSFSEKCEGWTGVMG